MPSSLSNSISVPKNGTFCVLCKLLNINLLTFRLVLWSLKNMNFRPQKPYFWGLKTYAFSLSKSDHEPLEVQARASRSPITTEMSSEKSRFTLRSSLFWSFSLKKFVKYFHGVICLRWHPNGMVSTPLSVLKSNLKTRLRWFYGGISDLCQYLAFTCHCLVAAWRCYGMCSRFVA